MCARRMHLSTVSNTVAERNDRKSIQVRLDNSNQMFFVLCDFSDRPSENDDVDFRRWC